MLHSFNLRTALRRSGLIWGAGIAIWLVGAQAVAAAPCTPTPAFRDGHFLTAQVYDPTAPVTGPIDATGCDIGVYTDSGHTVVSGATVENAKYFGILTEGSVASTDISGSTVQNIGDVPFSGAQHGIGIEWAAGSTGSVDSSTVQQYQKNGVVVADSGTSANVTNDTVAGHGQTPVIAENGIEFIDGASGSASGNLITDNYYTGCSNRDAAKTGCIPFVATGLLLDNVDPSQVSRSKNHYRDDQRNEYVAPTAEVSAQS